MQIFVHLFAYSVFSLYLCGEINWKLIAWKDSDTQVYVPWQDV